MERKNADYADEGEPLSNFKAVEVIGMDPAMGILMRCLDKFKRIQSFVERGDLKVEDEPVEDAIGDVINYMILMGALLKDRAGAFDGKEKGGEESVGDVPQGGVLSKISIPSSMKLTDEPEDSEEDDSDGSCDPPASHRTTSVW